MRTSALAALVCTLFLVSAHCAVAQNGWSNSLAPDGTPAAPVELARDGGTDYVIVIPSESTPQEQRAADELTTWLGEMSGAEFPIVGDETAPIATEISVGATNRRSGETPWDLGPDGYAIVVKGERIFLLGGEIRGPINAAVALLEEDLGCRWYAPGVSKVLHRPTIRAGVVPRVERPAVPMRNTRLWAGRDVDWSLRNRLNGQHSPIPEELGGHYNYADWVHTFRRLVPPDQYFDEHPEFFSFNGDRRTTRQLCVTNAEAARVAAGNVLARLEEKPDSEFESVSYNDGRGYCECPKCAAVEEREGGRSASLLTFVNRVAETVEQQRPDVYVSTLAYLDTVRPPNTLRPRDNVAIRYCTDRSMWSRPFRPVRDDTERADWLRKWTDIAKVVTIWDYPVNYSHYFAPMPNMDAIADNIRFFAECGVFGIMEQEPYTRGRDREFMRAWVYSKLMWDPSLDLAELKRDFITGYFAEAATPMLAYESLLRRTWEEHNVYELENIRYPMDSDFLSREFLAEATRLFDRAEEMAQSDDVVGRLQEARMPIMYVKLQRGPEFVGESYGALIDRFVALCKRFGIQHTGERIPLSDTLEDWRGRWEIYRNLDALREDVRIVPLKNEWRFALDPENAGVAQEWFAPTFDDSGWDTVRSNLGMKGWEAQGYDGYDGYAWYRQEIVIPEELEGRPLHMYFGAVDEQAWVYINGHVAFEHTVEEPGKPVEELWKRPFVFDATEFLQPGGPNVIAVRVHDNMNMGGIWKPACVLATDMEPSAAMVERLLEMLDTQ